MTIFSVTVAVAGVVDVVDMVFVVVATFAEVFADAAAAA